MNAQVDINANWNDVMAGHVQMSEHRLKSAIIDALQRVFDPEIPTDVLSLGIIYKVDINDGSDGVEANIDMTLTTPNCPVAEALPESIRQAVLSVEGVRSVRTNLVWQPQYNMHTMMTERAKLETGLFF